MSHEEVERAADVPPLDPIKHPLRDEAERAWMNGYARQGILSYSKRPPSPFAQFLQGFVAGRDTLARSALSATAPSHVKTEIVCLCGSTRFIDTFAEQYGRLTDEGKIVLSVGRVVPQSEQALGSARKVALDELHLRKIDLCDRVLVLNVGGYVGPSTRREIAYATAHGKPIDLLYPDAGLESPAPAPSQHPYGDPARCWTCGKNLYDDGSCECGSPRAIKTCSTCHKAKRECSREDPRVVGYERPAPSREAPEGGGAEAMREKCAQEAKRVLGGSAGVTAAVAIRAIPVPPAPALSKEQRAFYEASVEVHAAQRALIEIREHDSAYSVQHHHAQEREATARKAWHEKYDALLAAERAQGAEGDERAIDGAKGGERA